MISYKYVPYESGVKIIDGNSIGFSHPHDFNDPFELTAGYPYSSLGAVTGIFEDVANWGKTHIWSHNSAILSLTRSPLNPLMWSHYANSHTGFVIGFDAAAAGFTSVETNLVPVQFGSIIYAATMPRSDFLSAFKEPLQVGGTFHFVHDHLEKFQRVFLHKSSVWSYEEEVRIVKCVKGVHDSRQLPSGEFDVLNLGDENNRRLLYLLKLPQGSIKEVYLGLRNPSSDSGGLAKFVSKLKSVHPGAVAYQCQMDEKTWGLTTLQLGRSGVATAVFDIRAR